MRSHFLSTALFVMISLTSFQLLSVVSSADWYVDINATGADDGSDWTNAYNSLQSALGAASAGDVIHVAQGTYTPGTNETDTFSITVELTLLGGYPTGGGARDPQANQTLLSGEIGAPGVSDNINRIITANGVAGSIVIDGFLIAYADGASDGAGAYMWGTSADVTLISCVFAYNTTIGGFGGGASFGNNGTLTVDYCAFWNNIAITGGGLFTSNNGTIESIRNCSFTGNQATSGNGGALFTGTSGVVAENCVFDSNTTLDRGGAVLVNNVNATISNATFYGNNGSNGGAIALYCGFPTKTLELKNVILWGNTASANGHELFVSDSSGSVIFFHSDIQDGWNGSRVYTSGATLSQGVVGSNINDDPLFVDAPSGNFRLQSLSPCIDAGYDDIDVPLWDVEGNSRIDIPTITNTGTHDIVDGSIDYIDIGAYEVQGAPWYVIFVDANATGANDGSNWVDAYTDLKSALAVAVDGNEIWVAQGNYYPSSINDRTESFQLVVNVPLYGGFVGTELDISERNPATHTTVLSGDIGVLGVRGDNSYHVVQGATNATLDGFMITAGYASVVFDNTGAGLLIISTGAMTVTNCRFVENTANDGSGGFGGAIYANGMTGALTLTDCVFTRNTSWNTGGAIYMYGSAELVVDRCVFAGNAPLQAPFSGGGAIRTHDTPSQILSSAFVGNWSNDQGGSLMFVGPYHANVNNCTFFRTYSFSTSDAIFTTGGSMTVRNSILWNLNNEIANGGSALTIENNIISNGYAGNSSADPLFVYDIPSTWTSVGGYNATTTTTELFDTSARWQTDEFAGMFVRPNASNVDAYYIVSNTSGSLTVLGDASGVGLVNYTIMRPILTGSSPAIDAADGTATPQDVRNRTRFDDQNIAGLSAADIGAYERRVHFVNDTASGSNDGSNWANAYTGLQDALAVACGSEEVWVAAGTYRPTLGTDRSASFGVGTDVSLYGGFAGTETTNAQRDVRDWRANLTLLSGDLNGDDAGFTNNGENSFNVVRLSDDTLISGFFIRGGNANDAVNNSGGGIVASGISDATIYDCELQYNRADYIGGGIVADQSSYIDINRLIVIDCEADFGGGVCLIQSSDISIRNSRFSDNDALTDGGGLYLGTASIVEIINTLISDNWAWQTGGGLHFAGDSDPYILNCTIAYNAAGIDGDGIRCWDTSDNPWIINSIIWGNDAPINTNGSSITVNYSNIRGGFSGIGNIDAVPCFVSETTGNYALNTGSPCIDAGDGDESNFLMYDFVGNPRLHDDAGRNNDGVGALPYVDIGAYEFQGNTSIPFIWYVDLNATGDNNGSTWTDAFVDLQNALVVTEPGDQIWVAAGDYYPSVPAGREAVFEIPSGIKLYGGFIGTEVSISERNWAVNNTVLNADIGIPLDNTDNAYRLIVSISTTSLYIDGFTIANGYADAGGLYPPFGGGALIADCPNALIVNCWFADSYTTSYGGALFAAVINLSVSNCEFDSNSSDFYGGAAYIEDADVSIRDTVFNSNQTDSSGGAIYATACIFDALSCDFTFNTVWNGDGGAIYVDDAASTFRTSSFSNNYALDSGGAVYQYLGSLSLSDVTLTDNQADNTGGALYLDELDAGFKDSTFDSCYAESEGGAIYQIYGSLSATGCDFVSNQTNMSEGGALYLAVVSTDINDSYFYDNNSGFHAGAAYFNSCDVTLKNSAFESNYTSGYGGALFQEGSSISVSTCDFYGNYTNNRPGGALYMTFATSDIADSNFYNNTATDSNGGAIASSDSDFTLLRTLLYNNFASYDGAAISAENGSLSASGCGFDNNYSDFGDGGAIRSDSTSVFFRDTSFTNNYAENTGGAMNIYDSDVALVNAYFDNNNSYYDGGALYQYYGRLSASGCQIEYNYNTDGYGGAMALYETDSALIDTTLDGNYSYYNGGAVYSNLNSLSASGCSFDNNTSDTSGGACYFDTVDTVLINSTFSSNWTSESGGGLYADYGSLSMSGCWFESNETSSNSGGAFYTENLTQLTCIDSTIYNNTSGQYGGGGVIYTVPSVTFQNVRFEDNESNQDSGALDTSYIDAIFLSCSFVNNESLTNVGGVSYIYDSSVSFVDCGFVGNTANSDGGALWASSVSLSVSNCQFVGNVSYFSNGGAIYHNGGDLTVTDTLFDLNYCDTAYGGAVYVTSADTTLTACDFTNNYTGDTGGAIYVDTANLSVSNCVLSSNYAVINGGAAAIYNATVDIRDTTFEDNQSGDTGALDTVQVNGQILNCAFLNNSTSGVAGAIYLELEPLSIVDCEFTGNDSSFEGGAIYVENMTLSMTDCTFELNTGSDGGAVYLHGGILTGNRLAFDDNDATVALGGALYIEGGSADFIDSEFLNNTSLLRGGAIYAFNTSLSASNCQLDSNESDIGGAFYSDGATTVTVKDSEFYANRATTLTDPYGGGAFYSNGATVTVDRTLFYANTSDEDGGVAVLAGGTTVFNDCELLANIAGWAGGALYTNIGANVTLNRCYLTSNEADYGGAINNFNGSSMTVYTSLLTGNTAFGGGAIHNDGAMTTMIGCTVADNIATGAGMGDGVRLSAGSVSVNSCVFRNGGDELSGVAPGSVTYSVIQGGFTGTGNQDGDPRFVDSAFGDYRLLAGSPCIDAADSVVLSVSDIDGNSRLDDAGMANIGAGAFSYYDVGCYEFLGTTELMVSVNVSGLFAGHNAEIDLAGGPSATTVDTVLGSTVISPVLPGGYTLTATLDGYDFDPSSTLLNVSRSDISVNITADRWTWTLTVLPSANGSVSPSTTVVYHGEDQLFTLTPNVGYHVDDIEIDGLSVGTAPTYTFSNVTASHSISAVFSINYYEIDVTYTAGGVISPSTTFVMHGNSQSFSITPDVGHHITDVVVNGSSVGVVSSFDFINVIESHSISAVFAIDTFEITANANLGGTINPSGTLVVNYGSNQTFTLTPNVGYHIEDIEIDGSSTGAATSYDFLNITASHSISAVFAINTYQLTVNAGIGGIIDTPIASPLSVDHADDTSIVAVANIGYSFVEWQIASGSATIADTFNPSTTITLESGNATVNAVFALNTYLLTVNAGIGGTIDTPAVSPTSVDHGDLTPIVAIEDIGYHFVEWQITSGSATVADTGDESTTIDLQSGDATVEAVFAINVYQLTVNAGLGGTIDTPAVSPTNVEHGATTSINAVEDIGYHFVGWQISSGSATVLETGNLSTTVILESGDATVDAVFAINVYTITAIQSPHGIISPSTTLVSHGGSATVAITPDAHYSIVDVLVNGVSVGAVSSYPFINVTGDQDITAVFAVNVYTLSGLVSVSGELTDIDGETIRLMLGSTIVDTDVVSGGTYSLSATNGTYTFVIDVIGYNLTFTTPVNGIVTVLGDTVEDIVLVADFATVWTITATATSGGMIAPSGAVLVNDGGDRTFVMTPDTGYHLADVLVDGLSVSAVASVSMTNVVSNRAIHAVFEIDTFVINATATIGGSINPSGSVVVNYGDDLTFAISADIGHHIADVIVDGLSVGSVTSYEFSTITASHSISAVFAIDTFSITANAGIGGTIDPSGTTVVNYGDDLSFAITPDTGYHIADVVVDGLSVSAVSTYEFNTIAASHSITAVFAINTYEITLTAGPDGAVNPSGTVVVNYGDNLTVLIVPNSGYNVLDVVIDGMTHLGDALSYTFVAIDSDRSLHATFVDESAVLAVITASAGVGGSIDPSGSIVIVAGSGQTFAIAPDLGFHIADVLVDGLSVSAVSSFSFSNVLTDRSIEAVFAINTYAITASAGIGGVIDPSGTTLVNHGDTLSFDVIPDSGYLVDDVVIDGTTHLGAVLSYTFVNVTEPHAISVSFSLIPVITYDIIATADAGGIILPSGTMVVLEGADIIYTISADTGYHISDVLVDGLSVSAVTSFSFTNVMANHTIHAAFAIDTFNITATAFAGGTINPSGTVVVNYGDDQMFTISPDVGYHIADVVVDGLSVSAVPSFSFTNVTASHSISAVFAINTYRIAITTDSNGIASPSGTVVVFYGDSQTVVLTPDSGYQVFDVVIDGTTHLGNVLSYTFVSVAADRSLHATFIEDTVILTTITASAGSGGTILPEGAVVLVSGSDQTFAITPDTGYHIADVVVDGLSVSAVPSFSFTNVTASHSISAVFAIDTFSITANAGANGSINPSGTLVVNYGDDQSFSIVPNIGYHIADVVVDGLSVSAVSTFSFTNVTASHSISAVFAIDTFNIIATADANGSINPSGTVVVNYGDSMSFVIAPDSGYVVLDVVIDGSTHLGSVLSYTFVSVSANRSIHATFIDESALLRITASAGVGGTINPSGTVVLVPGADQTFVITPDAGYQVADVLVDGLSVGTVATFSFTNVTTDHTISAAFEVVPAPGLKRENKVKTIFNCSAAGRSSAGANFWMVGLLLVAAGFAFRRRASTSVSVPVTAVSSRIAVIVAALIAFLPVGSLTAEDAVGDDIEAADVSVEADAVADDAGDADAITLEPDVSASNVVVSVKEDPVNYFTPEDDAPALAETDVSLAETDVALVAEPAIVASEPIPMAVVEPAGFRMRERYFGVSIGRANSSGGNGVEFEYVPVVLGRIFPASVFIGLGDGGESFGWALGLREYMFIDRLSIGKTLETYGFVQLDYASWIVTPDAQNPINEDDVEDIAGVEIAVGARALYNRRFGVSAYIGYGFCSMPSWHEDKDKAGYATAGLLFNIALL